MINFLNKNITNIYTKRNNINTEIKEIWTKKNDDLVKLWPSCEHTNLEYIPLSNSYGTWDYNTHNVVCADCGAIIATNQQCSVSYYSNDWSYNSHEHYGVCLCGHHIERSGCSYSYYDYTCIQGCGNKCAHDNYTENGYRGPYEGGLIYIVCTCNDCSYSWEEVGYEHVCSYSYSSNNDSSSYYGGGNTHTGTCSCGSTTTGSCNKANVSSLSDGTHQYYCSLCGARSGRGTCSYEELPGDDTGISSGIYRCTICGHTK